VHSEKNCKICNLTISIAEFRRISPKNRTPFYSSYCKPCDRGKSKELMAAMGNKISKNSKDLSIKKVGLARDRAAKHGWEFDLDAEWMETKIKAGFCEATGIPFSLGPPRNKEKINRLSPSIDRWDNQKGYTKENCKVVISAFNISKNNFSPDFLKEMMGCFLAINQISRN